MIKIPCGVSARHIHLSKTHIKALFGKDYEFTLLKETYNPGYVTFEKVTVIFSSGERCEMHIVFPGMEYTQIELSTTDCHKFKIAVPKNSSGDITGGSGALIINQGKGIFVQHCVIRPIRHLHLNNEQADELGLMNNDTVCIEAGNVVFKEVQVRVKEDYRVSFHVDTDEGNAAGITDETIARISND